MPKPFIDNAAVHGRVIATTSVQRWTREPDRRLRAQALRVHELLAEYNRFWDYAGTYTDYDIFSCVR